MAHRYARPCDIDRSGDVWVYVPDSHKTEYRGRDCRTGIGPKAQAIIAPYLGRLSHAYIFNRREALKERHAAAKCHRRPNQRPSPRRTGCTIGERYDRISYRRAIERAVKAARKRGVWAPLWTPHQLRHSAATRPRHAYGIEAARLRLGHTSAAVTEIYAEAYHAAALRIMREAG